MAIIYPVCQITAFNMLKSDRSTLRSAI